MYVQTTLTVFNRRLNAAQRRDLFFPTVISSASCYSSIGSSSGSGSRQESRSYKIRIPAGATTQDGRTYAGKEAYKAMDEQAARRRWTLQAGDFILLGAVTTDGPIDEQAVKQLAQDSQTELIVVKDYSDNTIRGSAAVRHWRVGGV